MPAMDRLAMGVAVRVKAVRSIVVGQWLCGRQERMGFAGLL